MRGLLCFVLAAFALAVLPEANAVTNKVVCYYGSWAVYRPANGKFDVEAIDPTLCTHLIYTFVGIGEDGAVHVLDAWNDLEENWGKGAFTRFNKLRERSPGTKTLVAIGGWNEGSERYSKVMADDTARARFVKNVVQFVEMYGFDGFDLDWEYPNQRGGQPADVKNFVKLLKELRAAFDPKGFLLSAAVAAADFSVSQSYDVPMLSKYLDFINVMAYDLHGTWDGVTGQNAPLNPSSKDITETQKQLNVKACIETWIKKGANPAKIILGMGTYGRSFTLSNPSNTGIGSPSNQPGAAGPYTRQTGMLGYNEIVEYQQTGDWTVVWDEEQLVPYMFKGNQWVGYDNPKSIALKVAYAKKMGLGGGMIWSVETDDFQGLSGSKFPILRAINNAMGNEIPTEGPTPAPVPTTARPTTKPGPTTTVDPNAPTTTMDPSDPASLCKEPGYIRDPKDCSKFYYCILVENKFKVFEFNCGSGLVFDPVTVACNYPWLVQC